MLQWLLGAMFGLLIGAFTVLQLPSVQNHLFTKLLQHLSHTTQFTITHQRFQLKWLYHASLTGLTIKDPQDNHMLAVDQLSLKVNPFQLLMDRFVTLQTVSIRGAQVHLRKEGKEGYNMHSLLQRLGGNTTLAPDTPTSWVIDSASLQAIEFSIEDPQTAPLQDAFDYNHLKVHQINAELANLKAQASKFEVDIRHFTCKHVDRPLFVAHLSTSLVLAPGSIQCQALQLQTENSILRGSCTVTYDPSALPTAFYNSAYMQAHLDNTVLASEELGIFVPYFKQHQTAYSLCGELAGKVNDFHIKDLQLAFGERGNHLKGNLSLRGLPKLQETVFDIELQQGVLHPKDLLPYLEENHYQLLEAFALVKPQGHIYGKQDNFIAKATLDTDLGKITTDLVFRIDPAAQLATYKGALATHDFELGIWLNNRAVQQLDMQGQIDGKGLSLGTAHFQLAANIAKLGFNNYEYENIYTKGAFAQAFFQGQITVDDPHLQLQADAVIDLSKDKDHIAIQGDLARACLQALQLTDTHATLSTQLSIVLQGLSLDNSKLDAQLNALCFGLADKEVHLDSLYVHADQGIFGSLLELDSELVALKAEGNVAYTTLASDFKQFLQGFQRRLTHSELSPPKNTLRPYTFTYQIHCKDINPLLRVFTTDAYVAPGAQLEGSFAQHEVTAFSLKLAEVDTLAFKQHTWKDTQLVLLARQAQDSPAVSATVQLASKEQQWGTRNTTEDLACGISWENDQIDFTSTLGPTGHQNQLNVQGQAVLLDSTIELVLGPSSIKLADHQWHVHPAHRITIGKAGAQFQNFAWVSEKQQVSLNGILSADPSQGLHLKVKNFSLDNLNLFVNKQLTGALNAAAVLQGVLGQPHIDSDITLEQLTIDNFLVGDVHAKTSWANALKRLYLEGQVAYLAKQTVVIQGFYEPPKGENSLQLVANFSHAQLAAWEPLVADDLSQLAGELSGTIYIKGSPANPRITGGASITDAAVRVNYLNALYHVNGELTLADQVIHINKLALADGQQGQAVLQGLVTHRGLEALQIELTGSMVQFKLLDTAVEDNKHFYGTGILSGSVSVAGPISNLAIHMQAKTAAGTRMYIPISEARNTVTQAGFIRFVNLKTKYQAKAAQARQVAWKGLQLTMLLEITPDAYTELILNAESGTVIKGRGNGNLQIAVDTEGALRMAGGFEFSEGEYRFSLYPIVNKTFKILPQSKITWTDSPYEGVLAVQATYEQRATLAPLLKAMGVIGGDKAKQKYPVQVLVALGGALLSPDMHFQVNFLAYPSDVASQTAISNFQQKAAEDALYLANQVVSLVIFRGFAEAALTDTGKDTVSRSLSELVAQQLGRLIANLDEKLELDTDVDLEELRNKGLESLRFKLSRSFLDGRLRVSREGGFGVGAADAAKVGQIVGDWTVEYCLTQDGRLRAKLYNKNVANPTYVGTDRAAAALGGFSLLYIRGFNQWRELFGGGKQAPKKVSKEK